MTEVHWTEVDGVTTIWTDVEGPLRAGLFFRAGRADETLTTAGHTHLIEHITLSTMGANFLASNGIVGGVFTGFLIAGSPQDVSLFLSGVCKTLQNLSTERLEAEKKILIAESAARPSDFRLNLLTNRFGAVGHGLLGMPELGVRSATLEQLQQIRLKRFTRENAVLWLTGSPPAGLHLDLPSGSKQPMPALPPIHSTFPSWHLDNAIGGMATGFTVPRVAEAPIFSIIVLERLQKRLRIEQAVSYSPSVFYDPLDANTASLTLYADSDQNRRNELVQAFGDFYEKLTEINEAEVDSAKKRQQEQMAGSLAPSASDRAFMEIQRCAIEWIFGREFQSAEQILEEALLVSADDVMAFGRNVPQTTIFALPPNVKVWPWMGKQANSSHSSPLAGREILCVDAPIQPMRLVHTQEGVSVKWPNGSHNTILYSNLAAVVQFEDGCIHLVGSNANWIAIEPTLWRNGAAICKEICKQVPPHLLIENGSRPPDQIPKPTTTAWQRFRASLGPQKKGR
jgi:predicted Zn-dependent peptidase